MPLGHVRQAEAVRLSVGSRQAQAGSDDVSAGSAAPGFVTTPEAACAAVPEPAPKEGTATLASGLPTCMSYGCMNPARHAGHTLCLLHFCQ